MQRGVDVIINLDYLWQLSLIATVLLLVLLLLLSRHKRKNRKQKQADRILKQISKDEVASIVIPDGIGGLIEIERLILMEQGLLVIESYPIAGHLFGAENIDQWTQIVDGRSFKFANPLRHVHNAKQALQILVPKVPIYSRVVFTGDGDFPKGKPEDVSVVATLEQDLESIKSAPKLPAVIEIAWQRVLRIARKNGKAIA
jgi:hypothetical protein